MTLTRIFWHEFYTCVSTYLSTHVPTYIHTHIHTQYIQYIHTYVHMYIHTYLVIFNNRLAAMLFMVSNGLDFDCRQPLLAVTVLSGLAGPFFCLVGQALTTLSQMSIRACSMWRGGGVMGRGEGGRERRDSDG